MQFRDQSDTHSNIRLISRIQERINCRVKERPLWKISYIMLTLISVLILAGNHLSIRAMVL